MDKTHVFNHGRPLPENWKETYIDCLNLFLETRDAEGTARFVADTEADIRACGDPELLRQMEQASEQARKYLEIERVQGRYACLNLEHPFVQRLIKDGLIKVSA